MHPHHHIAPLGTSDVDRVAGRHPKKPWEYPLTVAIPHLDTIDALSACIDVLRAQTAQPYLMVIDTGSPPETIGKLETMRAADLEIHYIAGHAWRHSSAVVACALDLAQTLCRTPHLFHTHADCFLRRADFLENMVRVTTANTPVVGYRMSPREWTTDDWEWMVGHSATLLYMPSIHRAGATWSMERMNWQYGYSWESTGGWPDTEIGFNCALRDAGIAPVFIGHDRNWERQIDDNIDHVRSYTGTRVYAGEQIEQINAWMKEALREAHARAAIWRSGKRERATSILQTMQSVYGCSVGTVPGPYRGDHGGSA